MLILLLILIGFTICILALLGVFSGDKKTTSVNKQMYKKHPRQTCKKQTQQTSSYIEPSQFKTGYIKNKQQTLADLCRDPSKGGNNVMYPINPLYVDYTLGNDETKECDVNVFNSPP